MEPGEAPKAPWQISLHKDKKAYTAAIYNPEKKEKKVEKFDVNSEEITIDEHDANGELIGKSKQTNKYETVEEPIKKMEVDLDFRS